MGSYHAALCADATYLAALGDQAQAADVDQLASFELESADNDFGPQNPVSVTADSLPAPGMELSFQQSYQPSIIDHYTMGILGFGWTTNWDITASIVDALGDAAVQVDGDNLYFTRADDGSYQIQGGEQGSLSFANGAFILALNGDTYQFRSNGNLAYVQDGNGNRISLSYNVAGQLQALTDSNGESLSLAYNTQGRLATLTDSNGLTETYAYDPSGQLLTSYADQYGTTNYSYVTGQSMAENNSLASITYANNSHYYFEYDSEGRLIGSHLDGGVDGETFTYLSPGGYVSTDADAHESTVLTVGAQPVEIIDPLGNLTLFKYAADGNLAEIDLPSGGKYTYTYDAMGDLTGVTDALGHTTTYDYAARGGANRLHRRQRQHDKLCVRRQQQSALDHRSRRFSTTIRLQLTGRGYRVA